jgi:hypothetical protein
MAALVLPQVTAVVQPVTIGADYYAITVESAGLAQPATRGSIRTGGTCLEAMWIRGGWPAGSGEGGAALMDR